ncbi:MAG: hypothetical protein IT192_05130 [Microbacteriaceae bacterium]|nr:hypothetical protein [Microbacteriaceae bacterium]
MSLVNDPQIWTLLGIFAAVMLGGMTLMTTLLSRAMTAAIAGVNARIDGLAGEMRAGFAAVDARFEAVDARFAAVDARFEAVEKVMNTRFELLDRDISAISRKAFGIPED